MFDGLLVVDGRLKHASILSGIKNPIILPRDHHVSLMIVQEYHENTHLEVEWVLTRKRCKFWIVNARNMVKRVKRTCVTCKRLYAAPMNQNMADLPPERCLPNVRPFSYTGLDFFGPFYVKIGRSQVNRYGCVFTCFSTRAIHLEMDVSLDTDAFINAFIGFVTRRGTPQKVWSDNGTNLVGGHAELKRCLQQVNHDSIVQAARRQNVDWTFNPPLASHHGGVWERMIRVVRRVLLALLTSSPIMTEDILHTVLCEAENMVNSRPLTKSSDDVNDENALILTIWRQQFRKDQLLSFAILAPGHQGSHLKCMLFSVGYLFCEFPVCVLLRLSARALVSGAGFWTGWTCLLFEKLRPQDWAKWAQGPENQQHYA